MTIDNKSVLLLHAYHDGELSAGEVLELEQRLQQEPELDMMAARLKGLSAELGSVLAGEPAPAGLRASIASAIEGLDEEEAVVPLRPRALTMPWRAIAASLLLGLVAGGALGGYAMHVRNSSERAGFIENEIAAAHLRGLIAPQPFDIASSENHVVKPWFNGRTTIAPVAPNLTAQGFPLAGGRVDVIGGEAVPVLVYKRRLHVISVTVTPTIGGEDLFRTTIDGTNFRRWNNGDVTYWVASDVNSVDLDAFVDLYRRQTTGTR